MKEVSRYIMVALYVVAGSNHFRHPLFYLGIMPPWLPCHSLLVAASGICEVLFALLLLPVATRKAGAWLIIILLIAVFPANIQMAANYMREGNSRLWITIVRLPLQLVLILWAWYYTKTMPVRKQNDL